ncbi:hypothetical protein [Psychroserpens sp.]|uniref:hypothetical protein n=1 Tax=Psychroserpens sp. TaxID=2020870 RepID=UPI003C77633C
MKYLILILTFLLSFNFSFSQVGIGTVTPNSTLEVNGSVAFKVVTLNGNTTTTINDGYYINILPNSGDQVFNLPDPSLNIGRTYILRNVVPEGQSTNAVIDSFGADCVFFANNSQGCSDSIDLRASGIQKTYVIYSDGNGWNYGPLGFE